MNGAASVVQQSRKYLSKESFTRLAPFIKTESDQRIRSGELLIGTTLRDLCQELLGECSRVDQIRFVFFAAPIVRRIAISKADINDIVADVRVADLKCWLRWHDYSDPLVARMIDLHYFGGLSIKETAAALLLPPRAVIRDLRFAKSWLQIQLP